MCGILGIVASPGRRTLVSAEHAARMRDLMAHRGPDDARLVEHRNVLFAHRRLAVIDPQRGEQPMWSPDRRFLLLYNGELYNDAELRRELESAGARFETRCDSETVVHAFARWGNGAFARMRGMFAVAVYDFVEDALTLARDPLGIKPVYFAAAGREIVAAGHIPSILAHPEARIEPNLRVVSSYLTTIRTTLGRDTLFRGVMTLRPGEFLRLTFDEAGRPKMRFETYWSESDGDAEVRPNREGSFFSESAARLRDAVIDSVSRHLRSDVPRCLLLSGGLDSAIIGTVCRDLGAADALRTWCAGDPNDLGGDRAAARVMAEHLGAEHHEIVIAAADFAALWSELIERNGLPLSTPNETAIYAVARDLKPHATVALSGEGADELFGGYALPIACGLDGFNAARDSRDWPGNRAARERYVAELVAQYGLADLGSPLEHYLRCNSWIHPAQKADVLEPSAMTVIEHDSALLAELEEQFAAAQTTSESQSPTPDGIPARPPTPAIETLLRVHRRINLTGLLGRLDTSTMLAGVEGRTPLADVRLAEFAAALPAEYKIRINPAPDGGWTCGAAAVAAGRVETKRILRAAFADMIPREILDRPKASFPLPFERWLGSGVEALRQSEGLDGLIRPDAIDRIAADPAANWLWAWPLCNLAMWHRRWW